jgi:hypothetical protein
MPSPKGDSSPVEEAVPFLSPDVPLNIRATSAHESENQLQITDTLQEARSISSIKHRLYISHFLSTWNSRVFEFAAVLFLAHIFEGTLLPPSIYALCRAAAAIVFAPMVGRYVDRENRLKVVRISIGML